MSRSRSDKDDGERRGKDGTRGEGEANILKVERTGIEGLEVG